MILFRNLIIVLVVFFANFGLVINTQDTEPIETENPMNACFEQNNVKELVKNTGITCGGTFNFDGQSAKSWNIIDIEKGLGNLSLESSENEEQKKVLKWVYRIGEEDKKTIPFNEKGGNYFLCPDSEKANYNYPQAITTCRSKLSKLKKICECYENDKTDDNDLKNSTIDFLQNYQKEIFKLINAQFYYELSGKVSEINEGNIENSDNFKEKKTETSEISTNDICKDNNQPFCDANQNYKKVLDNETNLESSKLSSALKRGLAEIYTEVLKKLKNEDEITRIIGTKESTKNGTTKKATGLEKYKELWENRTLLDKKGKTNPTKNITKGSTIEELKTAYDGLGEFEELTGTKNKITENEFSQKISYLESRIGQLTIQSQINSSNKFPVSRILRTNKESIEGDLHLFDSQERQSWCNDPDNKSSDFYKKTCETNVFDKIIKLVMQTLGTLGVVLIIVGAVFMLTSRGDDSQLAKGKSIIGYTIGGLVVAFMSFIIVQFIIDLMSW